MKSSTGPNTKARFFQTRSCPFLFLSLCPHLEQLPNHHHQRKNCVWNYLAEGSPLQPFSWTSLWPPTTRFYCKTLSSATHSWRLMCECCKAHACAWQILNNSLYVHICAFSSGSAPEGRRLDKWSEGRAILGNLPLFHLEASIQMCLKKRFFHSKNCKNCENITKWAHDICLGFTYHLLKNINNPLYGVLCYCDSQNRSRESQK